MFLLPQSVTAVLGMQEECGAAQKTPAWEYNNNEKNYYYDCLDFNSIFTSIQFYLYCAFYNTIVSRCFTEAETPDLSSPAVEKLTGRNLEQDQASRRNHSAQSWLG